MASSPSPRKLSAHDVNTLDDTELDQYLEEAEGAVFFNVFVEDPENLSRDFIQRVR